jgi:hypothetical protein
MEGVMQEIRDQDWQARKAGLFGKTVSGHAEGGEFRVFELRRGEPYFYREAPELSSSWLSRCQYKLPDGLVLTNVHFVDC